MVNLSSIRVGYPPSFEHVGFCIMSYTEETDPKAFQPLNLKKAYLKGSSLSIVIARPPFIPFLKQVDRKKVYVMSGTK